MNRFTVCILLPFVIWGASKVDTDLAFACFCSSFFYVAYCGIWTMIEINEESDRKIEERKQKEYDAFLRKYPGAPPRGKE